MDLIKRSHMDVWTTLQTVSDRDKMGRGALDPCSLSIVSMASSASWGDGPSIHPSSWPAQRRDLDGHGIVGIWMYLMLLLLSFLCFLKSTSASVQIDLVCINFWPLLYVCCFHNFHNIRRDCISAARHTLLPFQQVTRPGHRGFCSTSSLARRLDFCTMRTCHLMSCGTAKSIIKYINHIKFVWGLMPLSLPVDFDLCQANCGHGFSIRSWQDSCDFRPGTTSAQGNSWDLRADGCTNLYRLGHLELNMDFHAPKYHQHLLTSIRRGLPDAQCKLLHFLSNSTNISTFLSPYCCILYLAFIYIY